MYFYPTKKYQNIAVHTMHWYTGITGRRPITKVLNFIVRRFNKQLYKQCLHKKYIFGQQSYENVKNVLG